MIKVFIVDDHIVVIEGLQALLNQTPDIEVIGIATNANECLSFLKNHIVDVILLDINLPDINGLDLCKSIKANHGNTKILALSTFNQLSYVSKMMENGASGYLLKNISKIELLQAIYAVTEGGIYHSLKSLTC